MTTKVLLRVLPRLSLLVILFILGTSPTLGQDTSAVRFVHVIPDAAPIDVYVNGTLAATNLTYREATTYITVPAGTHTVAATATGIAEPLWQQEITADADSPVTLIASSMDAPRFDPFVDNTSATSFGVTRLLLVHALADAPNVDIQLAEPIELNGAIQDAGTAIAQDMAYGTSFGAFDLPTQTYVVDILPTGGTAVDTLIQGLTLPLSGGVSYMAVVYGTPNNPQALLLAAPTGPATDSGFVRFAHAVVGAPSVDVYVNEALVVPQLSQTAPSEHIALPEGTHTLMLRVAGTEDEVLSGDFAVTAGAAQTLVALPGADAGAVDLQAYPDDIAAVNANEAVLSILNGVREATVDVSLADGTALATGIDFATASDATAITSQRTSVSVNLTLDGNTGTVTVPETSLYGGVYYNIILIEGNAFSGPMAIVASTSLAQTLGSAPGADTRTLDTETVSVEPTAVAEVVVVQPTLAPVVVTPAPQQATTNNPDAVTARVILDPSANLQLRQLPSPDALSLGLAPSDTTLIVNGREGRPVALAEGQPEPPEAEDFVDPATDLAEDEDLDPNETWLNVTYSTPDGGTIDAWILAQFVTVRDADGDLQRLANLATVPGNLPGAALATELTPPPIPEDRVVAEVFNLNPGINLNIRRTPDVQGEVLARLPLNTRVELLGFLDPFAIADDLTTPTPTPTPDATAIVADLSAAEWAYISYQPAEGGTITGWVSTLYVRYEFNGRRFDIVDLQERELVSAIDAERIGEISGGATQAALPTADPLRDAYVGEVVLDAGANLQFRRSPDRNSESLNLIPSGTQLLLETRTLEGDWAQATFEGQEGWVSTQFLFVTFNGQAVDVFDIPVDTETELDPEATEEAVG